MNYSKEHHTTIFYFNLFDSDVIGSKRHFKKFLLNEMKLYMNKDVTKFSYIRNKNIR